jgi:Peptidase family M23
MLFLIKPAKGRVTNTFGALNPPSSPLKYHRGTDFGHGGGTPSDLQIVAPMSGYISQRIASGLGTYGKHFYLTSGNRTIILAHLDDFLVGSGQVTQGQPIGVMGSTGTTAVHCHEELLIDNVRVDPMLYTDQSSTAGGGVPIVLPTPIGDSTMIAIASSGGPVALITDSAGAFRYETFLPAQALARIKAHAKVCNPTGALIVVTPEEYTVLVDDANVRAAVVAGSMARAVDGALEDNFAAVSVPGGDASAWLAVIQPELDKITANINDQPTHFEITPKA